MKLEVVVLVIMAFATIGAFSYAVYDGLRIECTYGKFYDAQRCHGEHR